MLVIENKGQENVEQVHSFIISIALSFNIVPLNLLDFVTLGDYSSPLLHSVTSNKICGHTNH